MRLQCQLGAWLSVQGVSTGVDLGASHGIGHVLGGTAGGSGPVEPRTRASDAASMKRASLNAAHDSRGLRGPQSDLRHRSERSQASSRAESSREDGLVRVWRLPDLEPVTDLRGHRSYVHALALAAGGRVLVSGGGDNTVRLWTTLPWSARAAADETGAATRAAVTPKVDALFAGVADASRVADALEADASLTPEEKEAALDVVRARAASGGR